MTLPVIETFTSLQGESTHAGRICFFIRLAGCNLRCSYCDTSYAWEGGSGQSEESIVDAAQRSGTKLVEITGGEPLIHKETPVLAKKLLDSGFEVLVETNGACDISLLPPGCRRIVDCKCPASGMAEHNFDANWEKLTAEDEVKFVVSSRQDFDYAVAVIDRFHLTEKTGNLIFSPVWGKVEFSELADWVLHCGRPVRMQLQMHKLIWGDKRGV